MAEEVASSLSRPVDKVGDGYKRWISLCEKNIRELQSRPNLPGYMTS